VFDQLRGEERLFKEAHGAETRCGRAILIMSGNQQDVSFRLQLEDPLREFVAVHFGKRQVGDQKVDVLLFAHLQSGGGARRQQHVDLARSEHRLHEAENLGIVIDNQDGLGCRHRISDSTVRAGTGAPCIRAQPPGSDSGTIDCVPCLLVILVLAFPRVVLVLMYLFSTYLQRAYDNILIPILGFIFLQLTTIVYAWLVNSHLPLAGINLIILIIAVLIDVGGLGGGEWHRRRRYYVD